MIEARISEKEEKRSLQISGSCSNMFWKITHSQETYLHQPLTDLELFTYPDFQILIKFQGKHCTKNEGFD